jgi:hypothetical protein
MTTAEATTPAFTRFLAAYRAWVAAYEAADEVGLPEEQGDPLESASSEAHDAMHDAVPTLDLGQSSYSRAHDAVSAGVNFEKGSAPCLAFAVVSDDWTHGLTAAQLARVLAWALEIGFPFEDALEAEGLRLVAVEKGGAA